MSRGRHWQPRAVAARVTRCAVHAGALCQSCVTSTHRKRSCDRVASSCEIYLDRSLGLRLGGRM